MSDWTIKECPDCKALYENCSTCGGIGQIEEVNTAYDQNQPIGDTPSDYPAVGGEPIDAKTGDDFMTVKRLQEDTPPTKEFKNVWQELDKMVEESYSKEKLNKDGTGVARARRGVNPNKTPHKVLQFVYVSKSECDICKQYDGMQFPIDSPNRPVIPRLETISSRSKRPYTHPNCKCKWVTPFSDAGMRNFEQTRDGLKKNAKEFDYGVRTTDEDFKVGFREFKSTNDPRKWDDLDGIEKRNWVIRGYLKLLKRYNKKPMNTVEKIEETFEKINPKVYGSATESDSPYGIQKMLDMFVDDKFTRKEKIEIEEEHNLDFTLENLLRLVAEKIAEKASKKMGLESRKVKGNEYDLKYIFQRKKPNFQNQNFKDYAKVFEEPIESKWARKKYNLGGDFYDFFNLEWSDLPSEIQDLFRATISVESKATEGGVGSGKKGHQIWMRGAYAGEECPNCMIRTEKKDGKCAICGL